ncbi:rhoptry neck protein 4, putative [Plasmodium malariae]|uniref:Rhoptry neck protein 4, putative n=1 Tax=Plasmodium malariae TaxID=5858 RepID=A0A1C3KCE9_PLAMA|nr:rhoptry neck protein 4, putative [Plasmodium malariae]
MSRITVFFISIFLVLSTFVQKVEPFEAKNGSIKFSFLEAVAKGKGGDNNSQETLQSNDQIINARPLQENTVETLEVPAGQGENNAEKSNTINQNISNGTHDGSTADSANNNGEGNGVKHRQSEDNNTSEYAHEKGYHTDDMYTTNENKNRGHKEEKAQNVHKQSDSNNEGGHNEADHGQDKNSNGKHNNDHSDITNNNHIDDTNGNINHYNHNGLNNNLHGHTISHNEDAKEDIQGDHNTDAHYKEHNSNNNNNNTDENTGAEDNHTTVPIVEEPDEEDAHNKENNNNAVVPVANTGEALPDQGGSTTSEHMERNDNEHTHSNNNSSVPGNTEMALEPVHGHKHTTQEVNEHDANVSNKPKVEHGEGETRGTDDAYDDNSNNVIYGSLHQNADLIGFESFKGKKLHISLRERMILEIMDAAKEGIDGLLKLKTSKNCGKIFEEALERLKINSREISSIKNTISLEMYDKILSTLFKILTELSYYEDPSFYESLNINKSILDQSLKELKIQMFKKIGVPYTKLPPILKKKSESCAVKDFIISITSKELAQRMAMMFAKWLSPEEYGSVVDFEKNIEINFLCAGASILLQHWKYYQNLLGFEIDNEHAFLGLIDELLVLDKMYNKNENYAKEMKKIKKSKAFTYCTKIMRIGGNIASVPFNHENVKKPSSSIIGSLGNLVKAHISSYHVAIAQRINSYFVYTEKKSKKISPLKVISVCTLLHLTDMLHRCSDEHKHTILDLHNLQLNILNMEGKKVLEPLVRLSYLSEEKHLALKEMCNPHNALVAETLSKLLVLLSTESHGLLANEVEKRAFDEDFIKQELKNISDSESNVRDAGEEEVENVIFEDL